MKTSLISVTILLGGSIYILHRMNKTNLNSKKDQEELLLMLQNHDIHIFLDDEEIIDFAKRIDKVIKFSLKGVILITASLLGYIVSYML